MHGVNDRILYVCENHESDVREKLRDDGGTMLRPPIVRRAARGGSRPMVVSPPHISPPCLHILSIQLLPSYIISRCGRNITPPNLSRTLPYLPVLLSIPPGALTFFPTLFSSWSSFPPSAHPSPGFLYAVPRPGEWFSRPHIHPGPPFEPAALPALPHPFAVAPA